MQTPESIYQTLTIGAIFARIQCASVLLAAALLQLSAAAATPASKPLETAKTIPWAEVGARVGAQYSGDGLSVTPTRDGARLKCVFQRIEGEATPEGLWLSSTATQPANGRFRVTAMRVGRTTRGGDEATSLASNQQEPSDVGSDEFRAFAVVGEVSLEGQTVRFTRPGLVEEYSVSMDGVQQDFVVLEKPLRALNSQPSPNNSTAEELRVELAVTGARVEPIAGGARLVLEKSGRKMAYSRLKVTDATGRELPARMEAIGKSEIRNPKSEIGLTILVDDTDAVYPMRIDPTFSDANWISMGGIPGADDAVSAAVADASGNLYITGEFTVVGDVVANGIAKWNGTSWSALGSGLTGGSGGPFFNASPIVYALAVSGSDLYTGGSFTTAGGVAATNIAKWNGSSWSTLGSGMNGSVYALAVSGSDLYAAGYFTTAGGKVSGFVAKAVVNSPVLTLEQNASGTNFIRFSGVPGTAYHLQRAPTLAGPRPNLATHTAPANGRIEIGDGSPPPGQAFYRAVEP